MSLDNAILTRLDFNGVDQLTDVVFVLIRELHRDSLFCRGLTGISLQGCRHITDQGVQWVAQTFPNLEEVCLVEISKSGY